MSIGVQNWGAYDLLKLQRRLARHGQLDVDCGQQLSIEQRSMFTA
jgi:hypothetical protein